MLYVGGNGFLLVRWNTETNVIYSRWSQGVALGDLVNGDITFGLLYGFLYCCMYY